MRSRFAIKPQITSTIKCFKKTKTEALPSHLAFIEYWKSRVYNLETIIRLLQFMYLDFETDRIKYVSQFAFLTDVESAVR